MKVLLVGQAFYRKDNGQAVFTINLAEGLADTGHEVTVLAPSVTGKAECYQEQGVLIQSVPALSFVDNTNITAFTGRWVERTIAQIQPDVVHLQDHYFLSRDVLAVARTHGVTTVGTNHFLPQNLTDNLPTGMHWLQTPLDHLLWSTMLSFYNRLDAVATPTETAANILRAQGISVPVTAISCGVDIQRFCPRPTLDRTHMRAKYGLALDKTLLFYVGRLDREKDIDLLIHAMARLQRNDLQLVIAGKGAQYAELEQLTNDLGLTDRVIFTGFVSDADLPPLLNSVDLFVMPSHAELQSIATLEAMASGLPILAANARALPELVKADVNGWLFTAGDIANAADILALSLAHRRRWATMGTASRQIAKSHAHEKSVAQYVHWYQQAAYGYRTNLATEELAMAH